MNKRPIF